MYPKPLLTLIGNLKRIPGVGEKTAQRYALWLMKQSEENIAAFAKSMLEARMAMGHCPTCFHLSENNAICDICKNPKRDHSLICVVAEPRDVIAIESAREYRGTYHVLGGVMSPMDGIGPDGINLPALQRRALKSEVEEVILAISPSVEGQTTGLYIASLLAQSVKVTQLSIGLSIGTDIEMADPMTLARAFENRQLIS